MLKIIKEKTLQKRTLKNVNKRNVSDRNSVLKTIGLLMDEKFYEDFKILDEYADFFKVKAKNISILTYKAKLLKNTVQETNQITNRDFGWKGDLHNPQAQNFLNQDFDMLIGVYAEKNSYLDWMISQSKAKFKVGFKNADEKLFDLIIQVSPSEKEIFITELKKYLIVLNKL